MKAYKGFYKNDDGTLQCRNFVYEEGKTYTTDKAVLCSCGFHACKLPMDVFRYYTSDMCDVEFHEVELEGLAPRVHTDSKICGTKITIGRKLTADEMLDISIKMMIEDKEKYFGCNKVKFVTKDTEHNFIDGKGNIVNDVWFKHIGLFSNEMAMVMIYDSEHKAKYNFVNTHGKLISDKWFDKYSNFLSNGTAKVKYKGRWRVIDKQGRFV